MSGSTHKWTRRAGTVIALLLAVAVSPLVMANPPERAANAPDLPEVARAVPMGGNLKIKDVWLDQDDMVDLDLTRFTVFRPDSTIVVEGGPAMPVPDVAYFRGTTADDPNSVVLMMFPDKGNPHGIVLKDSGSWMMERGDKGQRNQGRKEMRTRKVDFQQEFADRTFDCDSDRMSAAQMATEAATVAAPKATTEATELIPQPLNVLYTAHMIVDTDYEYWQKFWNIYQPDVSETAAAALQYLGDLFAYASVVYEREINTNFVIDYARLFATNSDPYSANSNFCGCDGDGKLDEVQDVWSGNSTPRSLVHFVSGKTEGCGCAYGSDNGVLCSQANGYGASSSIGTGFDIDNPGFLWEGIVISHEIGHNFRSPHTHNYCGIYDIDDPVDICVDAASFDVDNCLGDNNAALPGLDSLTGGTAGAGNGTIMSYCHLQTGGNMNIAHTFGLYTPYGKAPWRVPTRMLAHVQDSTSCMDLQYTGSGLRVTKDCKPDDPMQVGDTATCTIRIENLGPDIAQGIVAVDDYLSNGTFTFGDITAIKGETAMPGDTCTSTTNPQVGAGTVTCDIGILDAHHTAIIKIDVTASRPQNINDRVVVTSDSPDPDPSDNVAEDEVNVVEHADLGVTKTCKPDGPQIAGGDASCEIVVTNFGPATARGVRVLDTLTSVGPFPYQITSISTTKGVCSPAGPTSVSVSPREISCAIGNMWPGSHETVEVHVTSDEAIDINDVAVVSSTATDPDVPTFDPDVSNNTASGGVSFAAEANLSINKSDSTSTAIAGGAIFQYIIDVHNAGPSTAVNVLVTDQVPAGLSIYSVTSTGGNCNTGVPGETPTTCTFDSIAANHTEHMYVTVTALPDTRGTVTNDAVVSSDTADHDNSDNLDTESTNVEGRSDIEVVKVRTSAEVVAGAEVDYQVTVTNNGPSTANDVVLVDTLDPWMSFVSSNPACVENPTGTLTCNLGILQPDEAQIVYITAKLDPSTPDGANVNNTATGSAIEEDLVPGNNTDDAPDTVITKADLWIDKLQNDPTGNPSGTLIYTLVVHNRPGCEQDDQLTCWNGSGGPSDAQNVVVTDPLPWTSKKLVVQQVSQGCVYDEPSHTVTCTVSTLEFDQSASFEIQAVTKGSLGTEFNTATVASSTADPVPANNSDTVTTTVQGGTGKKGGNGG